MYSALDNEDDLEKAKKLRASCIAGAHCVFTCMHGRVKTDTAGGHVRYTVCTEANSTYMAVPNAGNPKSLQWDVDNLRDAFGGCGTDEDKVIRLLCSREYQMLATPRCIVDTVDRVAFGRLLCADRHHIPNVEGTGRPRSGRRN